MHNSHDSHNTAHGKVGDALRRTPICPASITFSPSTSTQLSCRHGSRHPILQVFRRAFLRLVTAELGRGPRQPGVLQA